MIQRRAYLLLAELVAKGVDEQRLAQLQRIEPLAAALGGDPDLDALAAEHHALLSLEVFPFEGVFLDPQGLVTARTDHLGTILETLAHASPDEARVLLDEHLLPWLPAFIVAVRAHDEGFYRVVIELALELVLAHRESLGEPSAVPVEVPGLLDDPDHDLRAIARCLTTPVQSGVFVSRRDIAGLGRRIDVPVGFGSRARMLEHVWRGAGEYGAVGALIDELIALLDARGYQELDDRLAPWIAPWALKLSATRAALSRMREAGCRELDQRSAPRPAPRVHRRSARSPT